MATINLTAASCKNPNSAKVDWLPEAAGQTFLAGQFVYLSSGELTACADDATLIWGMAISNASGTQGELIPVIRAEPMTEFVLNVYHATPASAVTATTLLGSKYGLKVASNKCHIDLGEASALAFNIQGFHNEDAIGDRYGRVIVKVLSDIAQAGPGEKTA